MLWGSKRGAERTTNEDPELLPEDRLIYLMARRCAPRNLRTVKAPAEARALTVLCAPGDSNPQPVD